VRFKPLSPSFDTNIPQRGYRRLETVFLFLGHAGVFLLGPVPFLGRRFFLGLGLFVAMIINFCQI
jgi:hypothetical protein